MEHVYRGTSYHCAGCGYKKATLTELHGSCEFYVCLNCKDDYVDWIRRQDVYMEFEARHESYIVAKRVASRSFKITDVGKRLDLAKDVRWCGTIKLMFEMRRLVATATRNWFIAKQSLNGVREEDENVVQA